MQTSAEELVKTLFEKRITEGKKQTDFAVVSCPASIIVLYIVNVGISRCVETMLTGLGT